MAGMLLAPAAAVATTGAAVAKTDSALDVGAGRMEYRDLGSSTAFIASLTNGFTPSPVPDVRRDRGQEMGAARERAAAFTPEGGTRVAPESWQAALTEEERLRSAMGAERYLEQTKQTGTPKAIAAAQAAAVEAQAVAEASAARVTELQQVVDADIAEDTNFEAMIQAVLPPETPVEPAPEEPAPVVETPAPVVVEAPGEAPVVEAPALAPLPGYDPATTVFG